MLAGAEVQERFIVIYNIHAIFFNLAHPWPLLLSWTKHLLDLFRNVEAIFPWGAEVQERFPIT